STRRPLCQLLPRPSAQPYTLPLRDALPILPVKITARPNGPYLVEGDCEVYDPSGKKLDTTGKPKFALDSCGRGRTLACRACRARIGRADGWTPGTLPPRLPQSLRQIHVIRS